MVVYLLFRVCVFTADDERKSNSLERLYAGFELLYRFVSSVSQASREARPMAVRGYYQC